MMRDEELDELIRAAYEPLTRDLPGPDSPEATEIRRRILQPAPRRVAFRRRLVLAAVLVLFAAGAATWGLLRDVERPIARCLSAVHPDADIVGLAPDGAPTPELCEPAWLDGALTNPEVEPGTVPDLVGCVDDGVLVVIPASDPSACYLLDLEPAADVEPGSPVADLASVRGELRRFTLQYDCPDFDAVATEAERLLAEAGLSDWTVEVRDGPEPCASVAVDEATSTFIIVPIPPRPPGG